MRRCPSGQLPTTENPDGWNGERLFQAKDGAGDPALPRLLAGHQPAIPAAFAAAATYRFGHSMLTDVIARTNVDPSLGTKSENDITLLDGFLNPPEFFNGGAAREQPADAAAGAIIMGSVDQVADEIDEFVTETARNNLPGLPLDLPVLNIAPPGWRHPAPERGAAADLREDERRPA